MERYILLDENGFAKLNTPAKPKEGVVFTQIPIPVGLKKPRLVNDVWLDEFVVSVPQKSTNLKFRLACIQVGILPSNIDLAIDAMESGVNKEVFFTLWNYSDFLERNDPKLILMASVMQIASEQLDDLFILADTL